MDGDEGNEVEMEDRKHGPHEDGENMLQKLMRDLDPWTEWAYTPRTVTFTLFGAGVLVWASGVLQIEKASTDTVTNVKGGIWAIIAVFLAYCLLQAPKTILIRPHPTFWKLVHGVAVLYLLLLTFLLFQTRDDARQFIKYLDPDLGVELPERSYGADCAIYTPKNPKGKFANVKDTLLDEFVIAHILGWFGKSIMVRNYALSWILSIGFEMAEVTFNHMLPNFNECWWDSIILDVLICNWFGIWAGMTTVRYFDGKTYEWVGLSRQPSIIGKVKRSLGQFTPAYWEKDQWDFLSGPLRFVQVMMIAIIILTVELNAFFLKSVLWIPPRNPLNSYRLLVWWLIANPAIREYNSFLQNRKPIKKVGAMAWLALAICILEVLIEVKFGQGLYPNLMPTWIYWFWIISGVLFLVCVAGWSLKLSRDRHMMLSKKSS